jgi:hypothetical protein
MRLLGNCAINTEISSATVHSRQAWSIAGTSISPSNAMSEPVADADLASDAPPWGGNSNCIKFNDARLQAVSSRNMYSLHGLLALIRPSAGQVCHSLMVVSNCSPGSAQDHAPTAMRSHSARAGRVLATL